MLRQPLFSRPFLLCFAANFFQGIAFSLFLHFPGFLKDLGAGEVQIGWIFSLTAIASIVVRPRIGTIMDTRGRRGVILVGNALNVVAIALYLLVTQIGPLVYLVRIAHGLAEALLFTSLFTYAADCVPEDRLTEGLAIFGVSGMLPISVGGVLGDWILAWADYPTLFAASLALSVVALLLSLFLRDVRSTGAQEEEPPRGFLATLIQRDLLPIWWIATVFSVALASMFIFLKTFVMDTGIGSVGGFFTSYTLVAMLLRVFFGWLPDRVGPKRVLFPALFALATGFVLMADAGSARDVVVAGVLGGAGHGYTFPILFGLVVSRARNAERGSAMAIYTALFDLGLLLGGPALGYLIDVRGYAFMYRSAAAMILAGALSFALWDRRRS